MRQETNPIGRNGYAFFDVDDTLISVKSMFSFQDYWYRKYPDDEARLRFERDMSQRKREDASWEELHRLYYTHFAGRSVVAVEQCADQWFEHLETTTERLYHTAIVEELRRHQAAGRATVFVSGSFPALLAPFARRLGVQHVLATCMEAVDGRYTGRILPPQTIGAGKATAVNDFLKRVGCEPDHCYAYGDDISDLPMLESVGHPRVVSGGRGLEAHARLEGWQVLSPV